MSSEGQQFRYNILYVCVCAQGERGGQLLIHNV